jgi:hypothetical protein
MRFELGYECKRHLGCRECAVEQRLVNCLNQNQGIAAQSDSQLELEFEFELELELELAEEAEGTCTSAGVTWVAS